MSLSLPKPRPVMLLALIVFVQTTTGCLSNEYRIPATELQRLAMLPPEARGTQVRLMQELGERRGHAIEATPDELNPPPPAEPEVYVGDSQVGVNVDVYIDGSGSGSGSGPSPRVGAARTHSGWRAPQNVGAGGGAPSAGWRGTPPGSSGAAFRGTPPSGGGGSGTGIGRISGSSFGGGGGGGGGGGKGGEALVVLAVVIVALAAVASVFLVASEGMRFDGWAQMHPDQPLHLKTAGGDRTVTLGTLTPWEAASAKEALVMDDEGPGLRRLDGVSLNRQGLAFKVDVGTSTFSLGPYDVNGMASHVQLGYFPTQRLGVMVDATLSGAGVDDIVSGEVGQVPEGTLVRHSLALELQAFPVAWRWLHLGAFAKGGVALIGPAASPESGPIAGGGALVEIAVTSRMALTLRAGMDAASLNSGWSRAGVLTAGVSIY